MCLGATDWVHRTEGKLNAMTIYLGAYVVENCTCCTQNFRTNKIIVEHRRTINVYITIINYQSYTLGAGRRKDVD